MKRCCEDIQEALLSAVYGDIAKQWAILFTTNPDFMISEEDIKKQLEETYGPDKYRQLCLLGIAADFFSNKRIKKVTMWNIICF